MQNLTLSQLSTFQLVPLMFKQQSDCCDCAVTKIYFPEYVAYIGEMLLGVEDGSPAGLKLFELGLSSDGEYVVRKIGLIALITIIVSLVY